MRAIVALVLSLAVASAAGGCGGSSSDDAPPTLAGAMCDASEAAGAGRVGDAKATFEDNHTALHELAAKTADTDRAQAAALLRAKEKVEADLRRSTPKELSSDLEALAAAVAKASGGDPPTCG